MDTLHKRCRKKFPA